MAAAIAVTSLSLVPLASTSSGAADIAVSSAYSRAQKVPQPRVTAPVHARCMHARRAVAYYRALVWRRQAARAGDLATRTPIARRRSCHWARYAAAIWVARAHSALKALERWQHEYAWWLWLPANWRALGACETGYGREPGNWSHDSGSYVSAFGIYRAGYTLDAHRIGNFGWDETKQRLGRLPSPREQYEAALSHLRTYGDGWGCPGP